MYTRPLKLSIVVVHKTIFSGTIHEVVLSTQTGELGIAKNHIGLYTALEIGVIRYKQDKNDSYWKALVVLGGFAEVKDNIISVLANGIEEVTMDSEKEDLIELENAKAQLEDGSVDTPKKLFLATQRLKRAEARVQVKTFLK